MASKGWMGDSLWAVTKEIEGVGFEEDNGRGGLDGGYT